MKKIIFTGVLQIFFITGGSVLFAQQQSRPIGINLAGVTDYSSELVFTDAFKQAREWIPFNADGSGGWDSGVDVPVSANGYPVSIPYDNGVDVPQAVRTLMLWDLEDHVPMGMYRLIVQGSGEIRLHYGATGIYTCPIDTYVNVTGSFALEIAASDVNNPINDIKVIYPEYATTFQSKTFRDDFLDFIEDFGVIRFMDWLRTNDSEVVNWSDRTPSDYYTQTRESGVAWEYITELCNTQNKDMWINIPHRATDGYIQSLAEFLHANVDGNRKIYLEYSNELWNGIFQQNQYATTAGTQLGYTGQPWEIAWKYTAKRSADVFKIFEDVFTDDDRLVKLIPSQAGNVYVSEQILTHFNDAFYNPSGVTADALTIAPYFAGSVADGIGDAGLIHSITVEQIIDLMETSLSEAYQHMAANKQVADLFGVDLNAYEGGQHLVANVYQNNDELTSKLTAANHHPDLQGVYCQYLNHWYQNFGGLFVHFSSHSTYSKYGSWGIKEYMDDFTNPKYLALKECVFEYDMLSNNILPVAHNVLLSVYPNPSDNGMFYLRNAGSRDMIKVFDVLGREVPFDISGGQDGEYLLKINNAESELLFISTENGNKRVIVNN